MTDTFETPYIQPLTAEIFYSDPKVVEAKKELINALKFHQQKINAVRPPDPLRQHFFQDLLSTFYEIRGLPLTFPYLGSGMGNGALVELLDGSVKYDFISGIGAHVFGHSHPDIIASGLDAALSDTIMQGNLQQNKETIELCELLLKTSKLDHCFLTTTGAMANENAFKLAFQKKAPASRILAFDHCFAGRTLVMSQVTDKPSLREGLPANIFVDYIPFYDPREPELSLQESVKTLKKCLQRYPRQYALMTFELIQGEGGFYLGSADFYRAIMTVLKEHNIVILIDEVQTFARLPALFAFQYFKLEQFADIVTIGKASQVCATLFRKELRPKPGLISQTFTGSTSAIKASLVIIQHLLQGGYFGDEGKIQNIYNIFKDHLQRLSNKYPHLIQGPYGIGCMIAFTPLKGDEKEVIKFTQALFNAGLITFIAGSNPTRVRMLIPVLVITEKDIESAVNLIEATLLKFNNQG